MCFEKRYNLLKFSRFVDSPVTCKVTDVSVKQGKSMCKWSSCREGCTSDMYQCYQVRVQYIDESFRNNTYVDEYHDREWKNLSRFDTLEVEVSSLSKRYCYSLPHLSGGMAWTYKLFKVYGWVPGQKYPKTDQNSLKTK